MGQVTRIPRATIARPFGDHPPEPPPRGWVGSLILALHGHPVEKRRRVVKGVVRRLIRNAGVHSLNLVIIDQSSRDQAEASLQNLSVGSGR